MTSLDFLNGSLNPANAFSVIKNNIEFRKAHPNYFPVDGLITFCGPQGSGKTLSAWNYIKQLLLRFPKCVLVSNVKINNPPKGLKIILFKNLDQLIELFETVNNGEYGVIYFIDEIQVLFNALLKRGMNVQTLEVISQQRKQRKHIVGTAQVFMKIDKVFREQMKNVVICKNFFKFLQFNKLVDGFESEEKDGKLVPAVKKYCLWFHTLELYNAYDTSQVISSYRKEYENSELTTDRLNVILKKIEMEG